MVFEVLALQKHCLGTSRGEISACYPLDVTYYIQRTIDLTQSWLAEKRDRAWEI
jgi:hypothetical protein